MCNLNSCLDVHGSGHARFPALCISYMFTIACYQLYAFVIDVLHCLIVYNLRSCLLGEGLFLVRMNLVLLNK